MSPVWNRFQVTARLKQGSNFPHTLSGPESQRWEQHRAARLFDGVAQARTVELLFSEIDQLSETADERAENILGQLYDYAEAIVPPRS